MVLEIGLKSKIPKNIEDTCKIFWDIEDRFNLLDKNIQKVKGWQIIRFRVYRFISELTRLQEQAHSKLSNTDKLKMVGSFIKNSFMKNPFFRKKCDVVVFSHSRLFRQHPPRYH